MKNQMIQKIAGAVLSLCLVLQPMGMSASAEGEQGAESVRLDTHSLSFSAGDSVVLTAQVLPDSVQNKTVRFVATDDAIQLSAPVFDAETGKTTVTVFAAENVTGSVIAVSESSYATDVCAVSVGVQLEESEMVNRAVDGTATAGVTDSPEGEDISKAFDNSASTKWLVRNTSAVSATYTFAGGARYYITKYALVSANDDPDRDPKSWKLYGSNDGETWDLLDTRSDEVFYGRKLKRIFAFSPEAAYSSYKLEITENGGNAHTQLGEIQLFECGDYPSWGMGPFVKEDAHNPILEPNTTDKFICPVRGEEILWTDLSLYNPTAIVKDGVINLLYRAQDNTDKKTSRVGLATSEDGLAFTRRDTPVLYPDNTYNAYEWGGGCEDPRVVEGPDGKYYIYYTGYNGSIARLMVASSDDLITWEKHGLVFADAYDGKYQDTWSKSGSVITEIVDGKQIAKRMDDGKFWMYWGESDFFMASSDDLIHWTPLEDENGELVSVMQPRKGMYDSYLVEPGPAAIYTEDGIFMLYNCANDSPDGNGDPMLANRAYCPGQVMFDKDDPTKLIHRSQSYFMYPEEDYELEGLVNNVCFVEGLIYYNDIWYIYYGTADSRLAVATWDPSADLPTEKEVTLSTDSLTVHAGQEAVLSAASGAGASSGSALQFVSTNPEIRIADVSYDAASDKTTAKVEADGAGSGFILAIHPDTFATAVCEVTATAPYDAGQPRFLLNGEEATSVAAGTLSAEIDVTGYYDTTAELSLLLALYTDGVLTDWTVETETAALRAGEAVTLQTPSLTVPEGADMTRYSVKAFLWDGERAPVTGATALDPWSPPNLALGGTTTASSYEKEEVAPDKAVDGSLSTRWASKEEDNQWLLVDLGELTEINQVSIDWEAAYASRYRVEVSAVGTNDADFTTVASVTDGKGGSVTLDFDTVPARYVRLYCETRATKWGNSVWELGVYNSGMVNDAGALKTAAAPLEKKEIRVVTDPDAKTAEAVLSLPSVAGKAVSILCLDPGYAAASSRQDGSDYLSFAENVCWIEQLEADSDGRLSFTLPLDAVEEGTYTLAFATDTGAYVYTFAFTDVLLGDVDGDGSVTVSDVVSLRGLIVAGSWSNREFTAGNLDGDETLSVSDVVALRARIVAGN
ncbi:MAG: discoidin domain-containing protein [Candidatus Howiella sp.]|jgi:predicted GH43/DUF377 family glycosyl hydrolase/uncharacterized protein YjdB